MPASDIGTVKKSLRYIASGSAVLAPSSNATPGLVGVTTKSTLSKTESNSRGDQRADSLGAAVVGVVVAARQRVGADQDAALDLVAEAVVARLACTSRRDRRPRRAARSARRRSARGWRTPRPGRARSRRDRPCGAVGSETSSTLAPSSRARVSVASKASRTPGSMPSPAASSVGTPRRRPSSRSALGSSTGCGWPTAVESLGSRADHVAQQQRRVGHVARERARLVQRRGEGDHPVARDRPVRRLEPDDPAQRGGLADRAAGVGADRPRREPRRDGGGAAARRAARDARAVPRVEHRAVAGVLVGRAHRELVLVGLAEQRRAGVAQPRDGRRRVRRQVALEDPRAGLARDVLGAEEVLDGQRARRRAGRRRRRAPRRRPT